MLLQTVCFLLASAALSLTTVAQDLRDAVQTGDVERVKMLLEDGADVNTDYGNRVTAIFFAKDPEIVDLLVAHGAKLEIRTSGSVQTPIENAAAQYFRDEKRRENWREIVEKLRDAGAEYTIDTAIYLDDIEFVKLELAKDDSWVNSRRNAQDVPLGVAVRTDRVEICKLLLAHKADPNHFEGGFPIIVDAVKYPSIVKLLIDHGVDLERRITWQGGRTGGWIIGDDATALHFAAGEGVPETVKLLIDHGVDFFARTRAGYGNPRQTALEVAAAYGRADNAIAILNHPKFGEAGKLWQKRLLDKCLCLAVDYYSLKEDANRPALVEGLLQKGADPNARNNAGTPVVQIAAAHIHPTSVEENKEINRLIAILTQHGANLDLFSAVAIGNEAAVERLLQEDPSLAEARGPDGYPALHFAVGMNRIDIVRKLLGAGCNVDIRNRSERTGSLNETPLDCAAFWGRLEIAKLLIEAGADVDAKADRGITPLDEARNARSDVAELVIPEYLLFLRRRKDGLYELASGQKYAADSVRILNLSMP